MKILFRVVVDIIFLIIIFFIGVGLASVQFNITSDVADGVFFMCTFCYVMISSIMGQTPGKILEKKIWK